MRNYLYAAATAAASFLTIAAVAVSSPATRAWASDTIQPVRSLLPQEVVDEAAREGQTLAHPLPDLSKFSSAAARDIAKPAGRGILRGDSLSDLVNYHAASTVPDREAECLATAVYYESKGEPLAGQLAVAQTVLNRTRSGRFPSSICGVVLQKSQFSFVRRGVLPGVARGSEQWRRAVGIAHIAQNGLADSSVGSALFFHARYVAPGWKLRRLGAVGNHIFYR